MYQQAQEVYVAVYGRMHPQVADVKYCTALIYKEQGKNHEAKKLFLESEAITAKVYGAEHSKTTDSARQARACA